MKICPSVLRGKIIIKYYNCKKCKFWKQILKKIEKNLINYDLYTDIITD